MAAKISSSHKSLKSSSSIGGGGAPNETTKQQRGARKSIIPRRDHPSPRSSIYRGVTRHRWTGRYEAHLWDKNCWNELQTKKGRQGYHPISFNFLFSLILFLFCDLFFYLLEIYSYPPCLSRHVLSCRLTATENNCLRAPAVYLGAYDDEDAAARAYDLAALKYWGQHSILNFPLSNYEVELKEMENQSKEEYIGSLKRKSSGFSRGVSKYRGVARHHHNGRWEARIGRVFGNKYLYLGTYATQEEAATAYDMAAIEYRGLNAVTNFDLSRYIKWIGPKTQEQEAAAAAAAATATAADGAHEFEVRFVSSSTGKRDLTTTTTTTKSESAGDHDVSTATATASALGLLLQTSKFKEMLDISTCAAQNYPFSQPQPLPLPQPQPQPPQTSNPPRRTFPEDIQTFFESQNDSDSDDIIFGELSSIAAPIFHCDELDS